MSKKVEILAPAGDLERAKIAFLYGADAIYIGGREYSLRANALNFSIEQIKEICSFAHKLHKKVYTTFNIIFHNEDLKKYMDYLDELVNAKVDALIIGDPFLIPIIKDKYPKLDIFLSTQNGASNIESVQFWLDEGVKRVVLAREVSKKEIKEIYDQTKADLEVFIHGAMCTNFSGRCVLSNYFTNRDANRGGCAQICRFTFDIEKNKEKFCISPKDLNMAQYIPNLIECGVKSLKIEGRMRSMYYLATVISSYRKLVDAYYKHKFTDELLEKENKKLQRVANRESSSHFFTKKANEKDQYFIGREEVSNQDFLGLVQGYDKKNKMLIIEQRNHFKVGDNVTIFGPDSFETSFIINEIFDEQDNQIECAKHAQQIVKIRCNKKVPINSMMKTNIFM